MTPETANGAIALRLLLLEDSPNDAELEVAMLEDAGFDCRWERVQTRAAFLACLDAEPWDCILSDYRLPDFNGLAALRLVREKGLIVPFILVSGLIGEDEAIESLKAGATDYVLKTRFQQLVPAVQRALAEFAETQRYREAEAARAEEAEISAALVRVAHEIIASLETPILPRKLCELTTQALHCKCSHAFLLRPDGDVDVVMAGDGHDAHGFESRIASTAVGGLAPLLERLATELVVELPVDASPVGLLGPELQGAASGVTLYVALRRAAGVVGVLAASQSHPESFAPAQRRTAHGIAQLASLALANWRVVQELEKVSQLKSDFVNVVSHELRTPLNIIMGYGDLLSDGTLGPLNDQQQQAVEHSCRAGHQLLELVNTILDVGLLEAGALQVEITNMDVADLLAELYRDTEAARGDRPRLRVHLEVAPAAAQVGTDRGKLKVIIKKVLDNAIEFTESGTVTVGAQARGGGIEITVADTGSGIAAEILPIIFQPFRQGESALTRRHGGVGIGLYVARRLLDALGGEITVASSPGHGSTFRIWAPSCPVEPEQLVQRRIG